MSDQKWYAGNGKTIQSQYGPFLDITLDLDVLGSAFRQGYGWTTNEGKKKIRINVSQRQQIDRYGNTHSVTINTWKPDQQDGAPQQGGYQRGNTGGQNSNGTGHRAPQSGYQQGGQSYPQSGAPGSHPGNGNQHPSYRGYDSQRNPNGYEKYSAPSKPAREYEDDIPY